MDKSGNNSGPGPTDIYTGSDTGRQRPGPKPGFLNESGEDPMVWNLRRQEAYYRNRRIDFSELSDPDFQVVYEIYRAIGEIIADRTKKKN